MVERPMNPLATVLQHRLNFAQSATRKFVAIKDKHFQHRMMDTLQGWGAQRTGRWAGRGLQLQNLKRPSLRDPEAAAKLLVENPELYDLCHSLEDTGSLVRSAIKAPEGKRLVVADLANIESRVLGWVAQDPKLNSIFQKGRDPYKDFATHWLGLSYDNVDRKTRNLCKPPSLGCLGENTRVLTDESWLPIVHIRNHHKIWDGEAWVSHGGVIAQGDKPTIRRAGVYATPDHLFKRRGQWVAWKDLPEEFLRQDNSLVCGLSSNMTQRSKDTFANAEDAEKPRLSPLTIYVEAKPGLVFFAPIAGLLKTVRSLQLWVSRRLKRIGYQTVSMPLGAGAKIRKTRTTPDTVRGELNAGSRIPDISWNTSYLFRAGITRLYKWIGSTTRGITSRGICDLSPPAVSKLISAQTKLWNTSDAPGPLYSSGRSLRQGIETKGLSLERSVRACLRNRSLQTKDTAEVPTFDIFNCGPRNQFVILTDNGPQIAHNCGYGLGAQGLTTYAESMGVTMDLQTAAEAVTAFRATYAEIPRFWRKLEAWWRLTVSTGQPQGPMALEGRFLTIKLPVGRKLYYDAPEVSEIDNSLSFMGQNQYTNQWGRITTWGGKLCENIVQAIARDVLVDGMLRYTRMGGSIVGHVHDEMIAEEREDVAGSWLNDMLECIRRTPDWAPGLVLDAEGYVNRRYKK